MALLYGAAGRCEDDDRERQDDIKNCRVSSQGVHILAQTIQNDPQDMKFLFCGIKKTIVFFNVFSLSMPTNASVDNIKLSYSKMNIYNKCAFRYYLDNVLNLNIYEESFSTIIGNMVHYVMENCLKNDDNDIDKYVSEFLKDKSFTKKEKFFLEKYHNALYKLLDSVLKEKDYYSFNKAMYEEKIDIVYDDNTYFSGIIDKILYKEEDNNTYMALIDYKTGKDNINLKYFKYGIDIQLPIYLYLSRYLNFKNVKISNLLTSTPDVIFLITLCVKTAVFPLPAPADTIILVPSLSTANCCSSVKSIYTTSSISALSILTSSLCLLKQIS